MFNADARLLQEVIEQNLERTPFPAQIEGVTVSKASRINVIFAGYVDRRWVHPGPTTILASHAARHSWGGVFFQRSKSKLVLGTSFGINLAPAIFYTVTKSSGANRRPPSLYNFLQSFATA